MNHQQNGSTISFPILDHTDITNCFSEMNYDVSREVLNNPTSNDLRNLLSYCLEYVMGIDLEKFLISKNHVVYEYEFIKHKELHQHAIQLYNFFVLSKVFLDVLGVKEFSLQDLFFPESKKMMFICSGVINFVKYSYTQKAIFQDIKKITEKLVNENMILKNRRDKLKMDSSHIDVNGGSNNMSQKEVLINNNNNQKNNFLKLQNQLTNILQNNKNLKTEFTDLIESNQEKNQYISELVDSNQTLKVNLIENPLLLSKNIEDLENKINDLNSMIDNNNNNVITQLNEELNENSKKIDYFKNILDKNLVKIAETYGERLENEKLENKLRKKMQIYEKKQRILKMKEEIYKINNDHSNLMKNKYDTFITLKRALKTYHNSINLV